MMSNTPENKNFEPTTFEYPRGYFDIQFAFAKRIVEIGISPDLPTAIRDYTAIHRRLFGKNGETPNDWSEVCQSPESIWKVYTANPKHEYEPTLDVNDGCHQGGFIVKPYPDQAPIVDKATGVQKIELHFNNHRGDGKSEFSRQYTPEMTIDMSTLITNVASRMALDSNFRPELVTLGSWMNNLPGIQAALPPEFVSSGVVLRPPQLSFNGDSLWGQFLKNNGGVNTERFNLLLQRLPDCHTLDQLVDAIPIPVVLFKSPIDDFFKFYNVENSVK